MGKNWGKSKTLWFNALLGVAAQLFMGPDAPLGHVLAPEEVAGILAVGNMALRIVTREPLAGVAAKG